MASHAQLAGCQWLVLAAESKQRNPAQDIMFLQTFLDQPGIPRAGQMLS